MIDSAGYLAKQLRWRWRDVLKEGAKNPEKAALQDLLDQLALEASTLFERPLSEAFAKGIEAFGERRTTFQDDAAFLFAQQYAVTTVENQDAAIMGRFKINLLDALRSGQNPKTAAAKTAKEVGEEVAPWERIARTEMARAQHFGAVAEATRLGVEYVFVPDQPKNCEHCQRLLGNRVFPLSALANASNIGRKVSQWVAAIPLHPNCTCAAIPASARTVKAAKEIAGGEIPETGVRLA